jgi:hypothetical protein
MLEKYISFLSFSIYKADRPTHVNVMGDKHFPWRPVYLYAFPTTPCVCLFAAGGFRRPAQENPASTRLCTYIFKSFFLVVHRSVNTSARHISGHKGAIVSALLLRQSFLMIFSSSFSSFLVCAILFFCLP